MSLKISCLLTFAIGVSSVMFDTVESFDDSSSTPRTDDVYEKTNETEDHARNETEEFLNFGQNRSEWNQRYRIRYLENPERVLQSKVNVLARLLKIHVDHLRDKTEQVSSTIRRNERRNNFRKCTTLSIISKLCFFFSSEAITSSISEDIERYMTICN